MALRFLSGVGEMGRRMRSHDWDATPLGDPLGWPSPLKTITGVMLGPKHPSALGRPFAEMWHEILAEVGPLMDRGYAGEPTSMEDLRLTMMRHGYPEKTYFTFSYSPLRNEDGQVGGVFCARHETTG
jgi:hypothetical protein